MTIDLAAVDEFMAGHARLLDRRRFELVTGRGDAARALAALDAYRNADGGYGWGLEPDLRSPESQPGAAAHAFEVFEEIAPATTPRAAQLCDWLDSVSLPDGGLPMALPVRVPAGTAPWWRDADPSASSLQITAFTAAAAQRVAAHDAAVAAHPWLERATRYCIEALDALDGRPPAYVLAFSIQLLDAVHATEPRAPGLLRRLGELVPADGRLPVQGGTEDEALRPLDIAPYPGRPARGLLAAEVVDADLDRLASEQHADGGWSVDYRPISPAGSLEWRGYVTVWAVDVLARSRG